MTSRIYNILQQIGQVLYRWWRPDVEEHSLDDLTNLASGESKRISLQCSIGSTLVYVGLNSDGILTWSIVPRELIMLQHGTHMRFVTKFSNLNSDQYFIASEWPAKNAVIGEKASRIRHEADYWRIRRAPTRGRILLQVYGKGNEEKEREEEEEDCNWQRGLFFIITNHIPPFEYKLGHYDEAKNSGLFKIRKY